MTTETQTINHNGNTIKVTVTRGVYHDLRDAEGMTLDYGRKTFGKTSIVVVDGKGKTIAVASGIRPLNKLDPISVKQQGVVGALISSKKVWLTADLYAKLEQTLAQLEAAATSEEYIALEDAAHADADASLAFDIKWERTHGAFERMMDDPNN